MNNFDILKSILLYLHSLQLSNTTIELLGIYITKFKTTNTIGYL